PEAGHPNHAGASNGGSTFGGAPNSAGAPTSGGVPNSGGGGGGGQQCFDPINNPELALDPDAQGCPCSSGETCVTVQDGNRPHDLALICLGGRWQSAEDGPCYPTADRGAACKVRGRIYSDGSTYVPDAHSCNVCSCDDGRLTGCTEINCPSECPPNGGPGTQCAACGPADECLVVEHTCLPVCTDSDQCNGQSCIDGQCRSLCG
ncbi:MAG TPA: hypothetical protein VHM25_00660, partial [Polyangiaceae bacterium]|nr:hypothetical protein [Polyangiaceae bacterium]